MSQWDRSGWPPGSTDEYMSILVGTHWMLAPPEFSFDFRHLRNSYYLVGICSIIVEYVANEPQPTHEEFWRHGWTKEWRYWESKYQESLRKSRIKYISIRAMKKKKNNNSMDTDSEQSPQSITNGNNNNNGNKPTRQYIYYDSSSSQIAPQIEESTNGFTIVNDENNMECEKYNSGQIINNIKKYKTIKECKMTTARKLSQGHVNIITKDMKYDRNIKLFNHHQVSEEIRMKIINDKIHCFYYVHPNGYQNELIIQYDQHGMSQMTPKRMKRKFDAFRKRIERKNRKIHKIKMNDIIKERKRNKNKYKSKGRYEVIDPFGEESDDDNNDNKDEDGDQQMNGGYNNGKVWKSRRLRQLKLQQKKKNKHKVQY